MRMLWPGRVNGPYMNWLRSTAYQLWSSEQYSSKSIHRKISIVAITMRYKEFKATVLSLYPRTDRIMAL